jgi:phosphoglycolate phosphatase
MAIRGILFDKDGTVIDYWHTWVPINREVALFAAGGDAALAAELLQHGGHDPETNRITAGTVLAAGSVDDIAGAFAAHLGDRTPPHLAAGIEAIFRRGGAQHSALIAGARETIAELKGRGFHIGLATNDSMGGLEASLAQHDILHLFDFKVGCDSGLGTKPDPRMVLGFCEAVGVDRGEVAMVGDAVHDVAMGRAAGVALNVGVLSGTSGREDFDGLADLILDSINDLPARPEFSRAVGRPSLWSRIRGRA